MKPTLLILAAGMASRYGSMKQIEGFGPSGETIMDYSIYDAIRTGFGKVVFIIRKEFAKDFQEIYEPRWEGKIAMDYVFQEMDAFTGGRVIPKERSKPWGTAHAVLCAKDAIKEPFAVINADDFYGRDAFAKAIAFLTTDVSRRVYSIIGYELLRTLSAHGTVNRGVCEVDSKNNLTSIRERLTISLQGNQIVCEDGQDPRVLPIDAQASMNFWCFDQSIFSYSQKLFDEFLDQNISNPKAEFFIPIVADRYIKDGEGVIKVIPTSAQWFGVTYKEDAPIVRASLTKLVNSGEYPKQLTGQ